MEPSPEAAPVRLVDEAEVEALRELLDQVGLRAGHHPLLPPADGAGRCILLGSPEGIAAAREECPDALGIALGCRILRAHDVKGNRRLVDTMSAVLEHRRH